MRDSKGNHEHGSAECTCDTRSGEHGHAAEHGHEHSQHATPTPALVSTDFGVQGITCSHCVSSVTEELGRLASVKNVDVELVAGGVSRVTVASNAALDADQLADAIDEAGYAFVDLPR
jgi:copper chaperone